MYAYTKVKGLEISVIAKKQKRDEHGASFQKKKKEQRNACIFRVSLIKQWRLITYPILGFTHWTFLVKITV